MIFLSEKKMKEDLIERANFSNSISNSEDACIDNLHRE